MLNTLDDISRMVDAYVIAALFTADESIVGPTSGEFDACPYLENLRGGTTRDAFCVCKRFVEENAADLTDYPADCAGHDLWYTRNGHGCGFWEADHCTDEQGERLTASAKKLSEAHVYEQRGRIGIDDPYQTRIVQDRHA